MEEEVVLFVENVLVALLLLFVVLVTDDDDDDDDAVETLLLFPPMSLIAECNDGGATTSECESLENSKLECVRFGHCELMQKEGKLINCKQKGNIKNDNLLHIDHR